MLIDAFLFPVAFGSLDRILAGGDCTSPHGPIGREAVVGAVAHNLISRGGPLGISQSSFLLPDLYGAGSRTSQPPELRPLSTNVRGSN